MKSALLNRNSQTGMGFFKSFLMVVLVFSMQIGICRAEDDGRYTRWDKAGRGLGNMATGWFEIVNQPVQLAKTQDWGKALFTGLMKGAVYGVGRTLVGAYEFVTSPIPSSDGYAPIMYPELIVPGVFHDKMEWDEKKIQRIY